MTVKYRYGEMYFRNNFVGLYEPRGCIKERIETYSSPITPSGTYSKYLDCDHIKVVAPGTYHVDFYNQQELQNFSFLEFCPLDKVNGLANSVRHIELDFQANNSFDLIPFLMDWDDTIAMFSMKMLKSFSYGAYTWGFAPFIQDIKSLLGSLQDIQDGMERSYEKIVGKKLSRRFSMSQFVDDDWGFQYKISGTSCLNGYLQGENMYPANVADAGLAYLDEIGLNIDAKVIWDIIPLSFVADYFLPIGDFLESLHPRGWFNPTFDLVGGYSHKATILQTFRGPFGFGSPVTYSHYRRSGGTLASIPSRPPVEPKFTAPSLKGIFNTAYLAAKK